MNKRALILASCESAALETRDLGSSVPHGLLPVDERNPILLANDGVSDNWQGGSAILLANGGGPKLAGIIVNSSSPSARSSTRTSRDGGGWWRRPTRAGCATSPNPIASTGPALTRPASGQIADTTPNLSEGAHLIVDLSLSLSLPYSATGRRHRRPLDRRGRRLP